MFKILSLSSTSPFLADLEWDSIYSNFQPLSRSARGSHIHCSNVFTSGCLLGWWGVHVIFRLFVFVCAQWCPTHIVLCVRFYFLHLVPYAAIFSGLSIFDCPFVLCTLPFSLDCPSLIAPSSCVPCHFLWIVDCPFGNL